jgi:predicted GIY-YIG superfamily endonuclease
MAAGQQMISAALLGLAEREHALYRFFDAADVLLYVGVSVDPILRMKAHRREKDWWSQVRSMTVEPFPTRQAALDAETEAIRTEKPLYNVQHNELVRVLPPADAAGYVRGVQEVADLVLGHLISDADLDEAQRRVKRWPQWFNHHNDLVNLAHAAMEYAVDRWMEMDQALRRLLDDTPLTDPELLEARERASADLGGHPLPGRDDTDLLIRTAHYAGLMLLQARWRAYDERVAAIPAQPAGMDD